MKDIYYLYIFAFLISFFVSLIVTPFTKQLGFKFKILSYPNHRSMHKNPTSIFGGLAIFAGFMTTMVACLLFVEDFKTIEFYGFLAGGIIIWFLGVFDDKYALSAKIKLLGQVIVALIVIKSGNTINFYNWPFPDFLNKYGDILTFFWIIGIINAINIIDGVDGLAAGVSAISSLCMAVLCFLSGTPTAVILSASLAGSTLGFLPRNFHPAEIFMGDNGAMFLGYVLAVSSIIGVYKEYAILSIVISFLVLAFPIFDVSFAIIRRALNKKPIMIADRGHLHHKLYDMGFSERHTVAILYTITIITGALAIVIAFDNLVTIIIVFTFLAILFVMVVSYRRRVDQRKKALEMEAKEKLSKTTATTTEALENTQ